MKSFRLLMTRLAVPIFISLGVFVICFLLPILVLTGISIRDVIRPIESTFSIILQSTYLSFGKLRSDAYDTSAWIAVFVLIFGVIWWIFFSSKRRKE